MPSILGMQNISIFFDRQLSALASELNYNLTSDEIDIYLNSLGQYGLKKFAEACLCFREDGYVPGNFPSIAEFERKIKTL